MHIKIYNELNKKPENFIKRATTQKHNVGYLESYGTQKPSHGQSMSVD